MEREKAATLDLRARWAATVIRIGTERQVDARDSGTGADLVVRGSMAPFENSPDGVLFTAPDGRILAANAAACQILGWDEEQICARGRAGVADLSDERWLATVEHRHRVGHFRGHLRMRRADGSVFVAALSSATFDLEGERRTYVIFRDASESAEVLARARAETRTAERVVETLESITDGYFSLDPEWRLTYINAHAEKLLGVRREEVLGRNLWEVFPAARGTEFDERYHVAMATRVGDTFESYYEAGDLYCEERVYPLRNGGLAVYFLDIAERHAAQREHERLLEVERRARIESERAQQQLARRVSHDGLTGLLSRAGLIDADSRPGREAVPSVVLFLDLDRFKLVNEALGHTVGDELLVALADRLRKVAGTGRAIARFGGDEFVVVLPGPGVDEVNRLIEALLRACRTPIRLRPGSVVLSASIGVASGSADDLETLLRNADTALYAAKDAGRDCAVWFTDEMHARSQHRLQTETELSRSISAGELVLHYQPAFDLVGDSLEVEALVRWNHPTRGLLGPGEFINVAEDSGLINELGRWIIEEAVAQAHAWENVPRLRVWVNVSARQVARADLATFLEGTLRKSGVPPRRFGIELTESVLTEQAPLVDQLTRISDLGVSIAIDDFGTGYSSLGRLAHLPLDVIKIDRSFVAGLGSRRGDALVVAMITLAHSIGATVIAEGVEDERQLATLARLGCDRVAGFLLARPTPADDVRWEPAIGSLPSAARHMRLNLGRVPEQRQTPVLRTAGASPNGAHHPVSTPHGLLGPALAPSPALDF